MSAVTYDADPQKAHEACRDLLGMEQSSEQAYLGFLLGPEHQHADIARHVETVVFAEAPFDNTPEMLRDEYEAFEAASHFYLVVEVASALPVGAMRVISNSSSGLKTLADIEQAGVGPSPQAVCDAYGLDLERVRDIGTLAITPEHRGTSAEYLPALMMYRMFYRDLVENPAVDHAIAILDRRVEARFEAMKFPIRPILGSDYFPYLGSPESRALIGHFREAKPQLTYWLERYRGSPDHQLSVNAIEAIMGDGLDGLLRMSD
jgi:hypothetical protein